MSGYKADPHHSIRIIKLYYQPVIISFYIKHHEVTNKNRSTRVVSFNILRAIPGGLLSLLIPGFELLLAIRVFDPENPGLSF
jgi:hypothetical protein